MKLIKHRYHVLYTTNNGITEPYEMLDSDRFGTGVPLKACKGEIYSKARLEGYKNLRWRVEWDY